MDNKKMVDSKPLYERLEAMKTREQIFGENLAKCRIAKGYSRKKLADVLGVTEIYYGSLERGVRQPPLEKIFVLADFLKVSVSELVGDTKETLTHNFFDYRIRRATKLANLAGYSVRPLANENLELEIPGERKQNENGFTQWNRIIPFKTLNDFVEIFETAEEKAIQDNITFDTAFKSIINDADKIRKENWQKEIENFVQEHGADKLLALLQNQN